MHRNDAHPFLFFENRFEDVGSSLVLYSNSYGNAIDSTLI